MIEKPEYEGPVRYFPGGIFDQMIDAIDSQEEEIADLKERVDFIEKAHPDKLPPETWSTKTDKPERPEMNHPWHPKEQVVWENPDLQPVKGDTDPKEPKGYWCSKCLIMVPEERTVPSSLDGSRRFHDDKQGGCGSYVKYRESPPADTESKEDYKDINGRPISLEKLIDEEPGWAASRIREGRKDIDKLKAVEDAIIAFRREAVDAAAIDGETWLPSKTSGAMARMLAIITQEDKP